MELDEENPGVSSADTECSGANNMGTNGTFSRIEADDKSTTADTSNSNNSSECINTSKVQKLHAFVRPVKEDEVASIDITQVRI